jgi:SAM-dependent methyltransferase
MSDRLRQSIPAILQTVDRYYSDKLRRFGPTARGVDWNSTESQELRFAQLLTIVPGDDQVSLNDYGCGYGALLDYLRARGRDWDYRGFDVSAEMIEAASARHGNTASASFTSQFEVVKPADYTVASGIFNVKQSEPQDLWREYVEDTLQTLDGLSVRGFAFNMLSTYSDFEKRRDGLFYEDPLRMFDHCKRRFSRQVALLHDYPLYEFTVIVRK